ncbi:MAG TPA: hypothetical protein VH643_07225 [Gemmataceae bacterium]|jgi:hypothetical protein
MVIPPQRVRVIVGCALLLGLLAGCGGKSKKDLSLSGKVSYKGQPVTGGTLTLTPTDGGNTPPANTQIRGDGTYLIVPPALGELKVSIETESIRGRSRGTPYAFVPKGEKQPDIDTSKMPAYVQIPPKYAKAATSGLSITIQQGKNEKNFDLTD